MTEQLHFHFSFSCIGEGNGNPLQCSCLENPMDGGAWWAIVHGVAKSRTRLSDLPFTFHFHALEEEMATHSNILAWRIVGTEEPGGLPSMGSHRVGHDWSDLAAAGKTCIWVRAGIQEKLAPILHDCFLWPFLTHYNILSLILVGICFLWPVNLVNFIVLSSYLSAAAAKSLQSCPILCDP